MKKYGGETFENLHPLVKKSWCRLLYQIKKTKQIEGGWMKTKTESNEGEDERN